MRAIPRSASVQLPLPAHPSPLRMAGFQALTSGRFSAPADKLGVPAPATVIQTMLMKDGYFVGHKLRYDGGYAICLAGGNIIEFYDEQGTLLTTAALEAETVAAA